jgi:hypothetical protein
MNGTIYNDRNDKIISRIFGVKDSSYVSKQQIMFNFVKIASELEQVCLELFACDPMHSRFKKLPIEEKEAMHQRAKYCKKSIKYSALSFFNKATKVLKIN